MNFHVFSSQVTMYKNATKGAGYRDLEKADLSVEASVQRLKITIIFRFLNRVKVSFWSCEDVLSSS